MDPKQHAAAYPAAPVHQYGENIDHALNNTLSQFQGMSLGPGLLPSQMNPGHGYLMPQGQEGGFVLAPMAAPGHPMTLDQIHASYGHPNPYLSSHGQMPAYMPYPIMPYTPGRGHSGSALQDRTNRAGHGGHGEVPGLENRRGSYSTNESTPATPFFAGVPKHDHHGPRVAVHDRSSYTTPSPQQVGGVNMYQDTAIKHTVVNVPVDRNLDEILRQDPPVPRAVPAVFTPASQMKSLEQSLDNRIPGNRNVYIRGLHPTTDDELLFKYASRFGDVETSKAIIDTSTGACKGFGFAKFYDVRDSEMCIRAFHGLGYEVGFARESFNSRLKAEGDDDSTNLYISNLPKGLTEVELSSIFLGFTILSSKILRDSMGNSRGVGFARFESRDVCDEVIKTFNGVSVGDENLLMNIRYADTPSQKELKRVTAERRQFRTNEYNIGAYGTPLVGIQPNMYNQPSWKRSMPSQGMSPPAEIKPRAKAASVSSEISDEGVTIQVESKTAPTSTQSSPSAKRKEQK
ncbi:sporulation-specific protein [Plectosphaerella plurivora]|uniref:Sporulation-specific protein n=1 Tax=Plectosphaerella plurivora TaxID=936078 RepID=A0A9P8V259_9PEZI|nr:sporulation-specific protein [Plectosphaerella plurivora]